MIHLAGDNPTERALHEAEIMLEEGVDGIVVENYHGSIDDVKRALAQLQEYKGILGINILPNNYDLALQLAQEFKASFIQLDYVAGQYSNSKFINEANYFEAKNKYPDIAVLGGVWPKYYQPVKTSVLKDDIELAIKRAEAIVVTGEGTGKQTPIEKIQEFKTLLGDHPLIIGAGLNSSNVGEQLKYANGAIVGSCFKKYGITTQKIERSLVKEFMDEVKKVRQ